MEGPALPAPTLVHLEDRAGVAGEVLETVDPLDLVRRGRADDAGVERGRELVARLTAITATSEDDAT